jgi:hypothetical protein
MNSFFYRREFGIAVWTVRIKVAKCELTFSIPIFAKIAVRAANPAESSAQNTHESSRFFIARCPR